MAEARGAGRGLERDLELGLLEDALREVKVFLSSHEVDPQVLSIAAVSYARRNPGLWLRYHHHVVDLIKMIDNGPIDFGSTPVGAVAHGALVHAIRINQERNTP
jgi:hypothetical protein